MTDKGKFEGHTPGPLVILGRQERTEIGSFTAIGPRGRPCTAYVGTNADANLYAAAPDLLSTNEKLTAEYVRLREALKRCVAVLGGEAMSKSELIAALESARAALTQSQE